MVKKSQKHVYVICEGSLTPLPENMLYGVDLEQIEKINDNELDGIVPVTDQISNNLKVTSEDQPMTKLPKKNNPKNLTLQNNIPDHSPANPNVLRPRIIAKLVKEAERKLGSQNFQQQSHWINPQSDREKSMIKMGQDRIQQKAPRKNIKIPFMWVKLVMVVVVVMMRSV